MTEFSPFHVWSAASPYALALGLAALLCAILAIGAWRRRAQPGGMEFALMMAGAALWALLYSFELSTPALTGKVLWAKAEYVGIAVLPVAWFLFARSYTGATKRLSPSQLVLVCLVPAVTLVLAATNQFHGLMWSQLSLSPSGSFPNLVLAHGPWFWVHVTYSYGLLALGSFLLLWTAHRHPQIYRRQAGMLMVAIIAPWIGNGLSIFRVLPGGGGVDVTPFAFAVTGLALVLAMSRLRLFSLLPALLPTARSQVLQKMKDGVLVLDVDGRVVSVNPAAGRMLGGPACELAGKPVAEILGDGITVSPAADDDESETRFEITLGEGTSQRSYDVLSSPVGLRAGADMGRLLVLRDITERRQAEESLKDEISRRRILVEQSTDGIVVLDQWGKVYEANQQYARMLGYSMEEVNELHVWDWDTQFTKEQLLEMLGAVDDRGDHFETRHRRKDGTLCEVEISTNGAVYSGQKFIFCVCRDITERKLMEDSLRRTQFSVDHAQDLVHWVDSEGRFLYVNDASCRRLGYSREELLGMTVYDVDPGAPRPWSSHFQEIRERGSFTFESSHQTKDGEIFPIEVTANYVNYEGQEYNCAFARDISERKKAEEALRLTQLSVDSAADLIHWISPEGRLLYVSDSTCRRHGYSREEMLGMTIFDLDPLQSPDTWRKHWRELKEQGSLVFESMHRTKDGEVFPVELTASYVECGGREYNFSFGRDITERKLWEEALAVEKEHLSLLNEAAVEMSHCLTASEVQRAGIRLACKATKSDGGVIWLLPSAVRSRMIGSEGLTRKGRRQLIRILRTSPAVERVLGEQISVQLTEAEFPGGGASGEDVFAGVLIVPVVSRGKVTGVMCLATEPDHPHLTAMDSALAEGIAALMGVALENARLYDDARYLAQRDPVTGLLNHRGINAQLEKELARSERSGGCFAVVMMDLDNFKLFNDTYGHVSGDQVLQNVAAILGKSVRSADIVGRYGGDEFVALLPDTDARGAVRTIERIKETLGTFGYSAGGGSPVPVFMSYGVATYPFEGRHVGELLAAADANLYRSKRQGGNCVTAPSSEEERSGTKGGIFTVLDGLVTAVDGKDHYTRKHSDDVSEQAVLLASELGLSSETQRCLRVAALLHDVGKIGIPDHILRKPGSLTEEEYEAVKQHVDLGDLIINEIPNLVDVLGAVRSHHERYDGQGYPRGLKGEDIPLLGRILAVTDAYSAMTSDRPYRKALTLEEARSELKRVSGTQLDPKVVTAFLAVLDDAAYSEPSTGASSVSAA